jgi:putative glutathione S-transferase
VSKEKNAQHPVLAGRYHLYISLACPFATAAYTVLLLKGLDTVITVSAFKPEKEIRNGQSLWVFDSNSKSTILENLRHDDIINNFENIEQVY